MKKRVSPTEERLTLSLLFLRHICSGSDITLPPGGIVGFYSYSDGTVCSVAGSCGKECDRARGERDRGRRRDRGRQRDREKRREEKRREEMR